VKITTTGGFKGLGFKIPNNQSQDKSRGSIEKQKMN
jgi:hypothetical protein